MENFKCDKCEKEYNNLKSLGSHRFQKHGIKPKDTYDEYVLNNEPKLCACGCGKEPKFLGIIKGYRDYIRGHSSRVNNNWGHNPEVIRKSHETQKKMYKSGELTIWNKGLNINDPRVRDNIEKVMSNPERGEKISKALSGVEKSEEHKEKLSIKAKERWANLDEREKQRYRRIKWFKNKPLNKKSKLESYFEKLLIGLGIEYESQYPIKGYLYDFYIPNKNVLIEVDGDWFHFNKNIYDEVTSIIQESVMENDKIKNMIAKDEGYILIRFWENDINNNIVDVINKLRLLL
jgi:very-short-patch-repair endonuclease